MPLLILLTFAVTLIGLLPVASLLAQIGSGLLSSSELGLSFPL
jgi:hypothetical protein